MAGLRDLIGSSSEYEEEEQEQETEEQEQEQEQETEEQEQETEEPQINRFTCLNDEYKDKLTYKKMTTGRENDEKILLCCSDLKQSLNNYFAIDEKEINERLKNNQILYEVIYGFRYIKPYIDLDINDEFEDEEVEKTFDYILETLEDKKLCFVFY